MTVELQVNGRPHVHNVDPHTTLLDALREHLALTGSKKGCDHGHCDACTVLLDGRRINSCLTLAVMHDGQPITTIEGLPTARHCIRCRPLSLGTIAFNADICTARQICSAIGMLNESHMARPSYATENLALAQPDLTDAEIRERMRGSICRCAAYLNMAAIRQAAGVPA